MDNVMSPADMRAVLDGSNCGYGDGMGFGGGWFAWILLFALFGGNSFGFGGRNQAATTDEVAAGFNFAGINNKLNEIGASITSEGRNLDNAVCQLGYRSLEQTSALSAQMASCCCDLKTAIHAEGEATRNLIQQNKIESLQAQINQLQLAQATCGLPRINQYAWGVYPYTCGCNAQVIMG